MTEGDEAMRGGQRPPAHVDVRESRGVQFGTDNTQINIFNGGGGGRRSFWRFGAHRLAFGLPPLPPGLVPRPDVERKVVRALTGSRGGSVGLTTALHGAGGFGKTVAAVQLAHRFARSRTFPGGVIWVTIGQDVTPAQLTAKINDICAHISDRYFPMSDPFLAGQRLADLLDNRPRSLLVIDDVWRSRDADAFMYGSRAVRLFTTRISDALPAGCSRENVNEMEPDQCESLVSYGNLAVSRSTLGRIVEGAGRWPLLLAIINGLLRQTAENGGDVEESAQAVLRDLEKQGPAALDMRDVSQRRQAVETTLRLTFDLLSPEEFTAYRDLACFPEDERIPPEVLGLLWRYGDRPDEVQRLCRKLSNMSLLAEYREGDGGYVRLHDVLRTYLRKTFTDEELARANIALLESLAAELDRAGEVTASEQAWARMPESSHYFWRQLAYHVTESRDLDRARRLIEATAWVPRKLELLGPSACNDDLDMAIASPVSQAVRRALSLYFDLLDNIEPRRSAVAVLADVLDVRAVAPEFHATLHSAPFLPALRGAAPRPPHLNTVTRRLAAHSGPVSAVGLGLQNGKFYSASVAGDVLEWSVTDLEHRRRIARHGAPVIAILVDDRTDRIVTADADGVLRVADLTTGATAWERRVHRRGVAAVRLSPDGEFVVAVDWHGIPSGWRLADGEKLFALDLSRVTSWVVDFVLRRRPNLYRSAAAAVAVSPDSRLLATCGDDDRVQIWDLANRSMLFLVEPPEGTGGVLEQLHAGWRCAIEEIHWPTSRELVLRAGGRHLHAELPVDLEPPTVTSRLRWWLRDVLRTARPSTLIWLGSTRTSSGQLGCGSGIIEAEILDSLLSTRVMCWAVAADNSTVITGDVDGTVQLIKPIPPVGRYFVHENLASASHDSVRRRARLPLGDSTITLACELVERSSDYRAIEMVRAWRVPRVDAVVAVGTFLYYRAAEASSAPALVPEWGRGFVFRLVVVDAVEKRIVADHPHRPGRGTTYATSSDAHHLVVGNRGRFLRVYSMRRWSDDAVLDHGLLRDVLFTGIRRSPKVSMVVFGLSDEFLAVGDADGFLSVWRDPLRSRAAGRFLKRFGLTARPSLRSPYVRLRVHTGGITGIAASASGTHIATSGVGGEIHVRSVARLTETRWVATQGGSVSSVSWSPDDRRLASLGGSLLKIWDPMTGTCVAAMRFDSAVSDAVWTGPSTIEVSEPAGPRTFEILD